MLNMLLIENPLYYTVDGMDVFPPPISPFELFPSWRLFATRKYKGYLAVNFLLELTLYGVNSLYLVNTETESISSLVLSKRLGRGCSIPILIFIINCFSQFTTCQTSWDEWESTVSKVCKSCWYHRIGLPANFLWYQPIFVSFFLVVDQ